MMFSTKDFFSKRDQIRKKLRFGQIYWRNPLQKTSFFVQWLVPKFSKCIPSVHKCVLEILSLEIKPNPFNMHFSLKQSFTCCIRRVNAVLFLGNIDNIISSLTVRSMEDLPMLIISSVSFSIFYLSFVWLFTSLEPISNKTT